MADIKAIVAKAKELLTAEAVVVTAADIEKGVIEQLQVYFWSEGQAVMDVIT